MATDGHRWTQMAVRAFGQNMPLRWSLDCPTVQKLQRGGAYGAARDEAGSRFRAAVKRRPRAIRGAGAQSVKRRRRALFAAPGMPEI